MKKAPNKSLILLIFCFCSISLFGQDLTGTWSCDNGGTYYFRQNGDELWWYGDGGTDWKNVFHGEIHGTQIFGSWADVPSGRKQNTGSLTLEIVSSTKIRRIWTSGNYGGTIWTKGKPTGSQTGEYDSPAGEWDTGEYNTMTLKVNGNRVTGTYDYKDGRIEGVLNGKVIEGKWYQSNGSGAFTFTFNDDFTSFSSRYQGSSGNWYTDWKGTRIRNVAKP